MWGSESAGHLLLSLELGYLQGTESASIVEMSGMIPEEMVGKKALGWGKDDYCHVGLMHFAYRLSLLLVE